MFKANERHQLNSWNIVSANAIVMQPLSCAKNLPSYPETTIGTEDIS